MKPSQRSDRPSRLTPEARRGQIVEAAARAALAQGHLPLRFEALARAVGVSKALVYAYFPNQHALFNAVLKREFRALEVRGLAQAAAQRDLNAAALGCAQIYFEHVASAGPLIHVILRDPYMAGHVGPEIAGFRDHIVLPLARLSRVALRLTAKETIAAINMVITIPEETGRLVYVGDLSLERGRLLCRQLVESSLGAFNPPLGASLPRV